MPLNLLRILTSALTPLPRTMKESILDGAHDPHVGYEDGTAMVDIVVLGWGERCEGPLTAWFAAGAHRRVGVRELERAGGAVTEGRG